MSYSTFYGVRKNGSTEAIVQQRNSWLYAHRVWDAIWKRYGGPGNCFEALDALWKLQHDSRLTRPDLLAFLSTFDMVWIPKAMHAEVAAAVRALGAILPPELDDRMAMKGFHGWTCQGTSVAEDMWTYYTAKGHYQRQRNVYKGPAFKEQMPWPIDSHPMLKESK